MFEDIPEETVLAVKRGAYWLDERRPGWEHDIDLGRFSIAHGCMCVLGQVADAVLGASNDRPSGFYLCTPDADEDWTTDQFVLARARLIVKEDPSHLGFDVPDTGVPGLPGGGQSIQFEDLQNAWVELISERQSAG